MFWDTHNERGYTQAHNTANSHSSTRLRNTASSDRFFSALISLVVYGIYHCIHVNNRSSFKRAIHCLIGTFSLVCSKIGSCNAQEESLQVHLIANKKSEQVVSKQSCHRINKEHMRRCITRLTLRGQTIKTHY